MRTTVAPDEEAERDGTGAWDMACDPLGILTAGPRPAVELAAPPRYNHSRVRAFGINCGNISHRMRYRDEPHDGD